MSALGSANLQNSATGLLASQSGQPAGPSVFSGNLSVDEGLKLSNENFKLLIENSFNRNKTPLSQVQRNPAFPTPNLLAHLASKENLASKWGYFFKGIDVPPVIQLTATPPFPTPHVLAQFAYMAYEDYKEGETRLALPDGWKLLTTASNGSKTNGYFGAAYWHPEHQQVVIAHRGTDPKNFGALWTDVVGVVFKHHVSQMDSASTFAHKVVEVLREVKREKGVSFQLFFTGHSLGGWLAQITTFATEFLKTENKNFLKSNNDQDCFHPHTVVFDSPGCKDMLLQMTDKLDVRLHGRSIDIEHLDITSYLSAPNRINTCNKHVGTVCRIFPDLSDMGLGGKHTPLYNLATHSMQKILQAFNPETGQVYRDEQGHLKVQVVVDWPISAGILGGEEYKRFFEWAKHLNNYHPSTKDVSFQHMHYYPIRYQTILYDDRVNNFNIFSEKEKEFLQCYRWLRQWREFFKPKELFSVLKDIQAQEDAEKILQSFEIETGTIRCTDASALQALIPYVKRLLQLFPQIKEITKHALSSEGVRNRVYQFETSRYVDRIRQSPLEFKFDVSNFREFLESDEQKVMNLQMVKGDVWTGLIKVYQVLKKNNHLIEGQYTLLKLQRLLTVNQLMNLSKLMQSTVVSYVLLIACEDNQVLDEETKDEIRTLFDTIKEKPNIKIIFTTQSGGSIVAFLQDMGRRKLGEGFVRRDEQLTWSDLTTISQKKLLEKSVAFQGAQVFLNELMSADSPAAKFLPLGALLQELTIADPVPISHSYNEGYYIARTLRRQKAIKEDIFNDKDVRNSLVYLASTEQEFKQFCQQNPKSNVHWLEKDKSGKLFWQQSQGSLETLREYIDSESSHTSTADLDELLEQAQKQRVMLISDTAGMGKSTLLTHLSQQIKHKFPAKWVVRIDLNDHTDALKALKQQQIDKKTAIEFVSGKLLNVKPGLEMELFKQCCGQKQKDRIVIMLDGFDEISPYYKETVIRLLQALRETDVEQLWVTTRPHLREELEDKLQQLSYTLEPFSDKNQIEFLTKFWRTEQDDIGEEGEKKLKVYAEHLIKKLANSISDKDRELTGIPLQTRMLAEAFDEKVRKFCQSAESTPELPSKLNLLDLYRRFIERKYDIYQKEKFQVNASKVVAIEQRERDLKNMREDHQLLALKVLFTEEQVTLFQNKKECSFSKEQLTRFGIVQVSDDGKPRFIHRTFAEYYVADCLVNPLTEGNNTSEQVLTFILKDIFQKEDYRVVRVFMDGFLSRLKPSKGVLKQYGNEIHGLGKYAKEIFKQAVLEGNANIVGLLLDCVQAADHTDTVNEMLLANYSVRSTAWHNAIFQNNIHVLEKLWEWTKENLTTDEINKKLLLATDHNGMTIWHVAAEWDKPEILEKVWDMAEEKLTTEELKSKLLLVTDKMGRTDWHVAAERVTPEILQKLWEWAKRTLTTEEINNKLLATDGEGRTIWHVAAKRGKSEILQKVWEWLKEKLTTEEIINKLLLATDNKGSTVWHAAAEQDKPETLQKVWECAKEKLTTEEIKNKLLLATDNKGSTAWHMAAECGKPEILQKIWEWAEEELTAEEINNKLLLATDKKGSTIWHVAAEKGTPEILQKVWEWAKEKLTIEEIKNKLLLGTDSKGSTAWYVAAKRGKPEILQKVWECAKEKLTTEEINNNLFLATDGEGRTVWCVAAECGKPEILQKVLDWAKENLTTEEIKNKLLIATDNKGSTVWHVAAEQGTPEILEKVWGWAKENLTTEEMNSYLLLAADGEERTVWHVAAMRGKSEILQKVWEWAIEKLTTEEINNKLLLATDGEGRTIWHVAARRGKSEILQIVWEWAKEKLTTEEINNKLLLATDYEGNTIWHMAAECGKPEILQNVWEWAKERLTTEEINNKLLLARDREGRTIWHVAAKNGTLEIFQKVWEWAKEKLTTEEINNKLLLATDREGRTVWHVAAKNGTQKILQKVWEWAKEKLTTEEINNKLLLATDHNRMTVWHVAAEWDNPEILQKVWELAKEELTTEETKKTLLLATDGEGRTVWHLAAQCITPEILQKVWDMAEEKLTTEEINKLLLATDKMGRTICHLAAEIVNLKALQKIWEWAIRKLTAEEINNKLLLATDCYGRTVLHVAAEWVTPKLLHNVWEWAEEAGITEEMYNKLLLVTDSEGRTVLHVAAECGTPEILHKVWEWAKEARITEEMYNKLLLATDNEGRTVLEVAAERLNVEILEQLRSRLKRN